MGGQKAGAIARDPLLKWYGELFADALKQPDARLMTIGYGFKDGHINTAIRDGLKTGLKLFNISPQGADAWTETPGAGPGTIRGKNYLNDHLIGASRRGILEIVDPKKAEHGKVLRFFA